MGVGKLSATKEVSINVASSPKDLYLWLDALILHLQGIQPYFCSAHRHTRPNLTCKNNPHEVKTAQWRMNLFTLRPLLTKLLLLLPIYTTGSLASAFSTQGVGMHICLQHRQPTPMDAEKTPQRRKAPQDQPKMRRFEMSSCAQRGFVQPFALIPHLKHQLGCFTPVRKWCFMQLSIFSGAGVSFLFYRFHIW